LKLEYPVGESCCILRLNSLSLPQTNSSSSSKPHGLSADLVAPPRFSGGTWKIAIEASAGDAITSSGIPWLSSWKHPTVAKESEMTWRRASSEHKELKSTFGSGFRWLLLMFGRRREVSKNRRKTSSLESEDVRLAEATGDGGGARKSIAVRQRREGIRYESTFLIHLWVLFLLLKEEK